MSVQITVTGPVYVDTGLRDRVAALETQFATFKQEDTMQFDTVLSLIAAVKTSTDALATKQTTEQADIAAAKAKLDDVLAQLAAGAASQAQVDQATTALQGISASLGTVTASMDANIAILAAMGTDPANPVPTVPPATPPADQV